MKVILILLFLSTSVFAVDFDERYFDRPMREVSVIVTDSGFFPDQMMAFEGEKIKFYITSTAGKNQCFVLQKHEVFIAAEKGLINEGEVTLDNAGKFKFYCPSFKYQGWLTVIEKGKPKEQRKPASVEEKPNYWLPRDYDKGFK